MRGYTVTITPSGDRSGRKTTIQVDTTSGAAQVTELTFKSGGNGLSPQEIPVIDFALLVSALAPNATPAIASTPAAASAPAASRSRAHQPRGRRARPVVQEPAKATRGRRRAAAKAAEQPTAGRAYRRMPAPDDVVAAWNESPSASALAAHFDVPRHTAQGWLRRLRSMGVIEPAS